MSQRQQWEVAVLTARLPAQVTSSIIGALLAPGPIEAYAHCPWEPMQRFSDPVMQTVRPERARELLADELRQARSLVWTPLADLCRLERNAPLAVHAARLAQLYGALARCSGAALAAAEMRQALDALR